MSRHLKCCTLSCPFSEHSMVMVKMVWLLDEALFMLVEPTLRFLLPIVMILSRSSAELTTNADRS